VIWIARNPRNGITYIIGWYKNATIYSDNDHISLTRRGGIEVNYQIEASAADATLLPLEQRLFSIPTSKKPGHLGQSPIWYGGTDNFRQTVGEYLENGGLLKKTVKAKGGRQHDPDARKRIELAAIEHATQFYRSDKGGNREVNSVEKDGIGWDLTVTAASGEILKVEVKGLSGRELIVELTPNEYKQMCSTEHREGYIVYVVTEAGTPDAKSHIFYHDRENSSRRKLLWTAVDGRILKIEERVAARLST
jgi:Protein NO VEIN, C-terminal